VSGLVVLLKIGCLARSGKLRAAGPSLAALVLCAGLPMIAWLAWCKHTFGDFSGTAAKIQFLGWTHQPMGEWWHHPFLRHTVCGPLGRDSWQRSGRGNFSGIASRWCRRLWTRFTPFHQSALSGWRWSRCFHVP